MRLDIVGMLSLRHFFGTLDLDTVFLYLFIDGSPQRRGVELFASTLDIICGTFFMRRALPFVAPLIGLTTLAKCSTLLWQLYLVCGPCFIRFRKVLSRVRSITTDMGVEHRIPSYVDISKDFMWFIGDRTDWSSLPDMPRLFERCLLAAGWRHGWDLVLRKALFSLTFFPGWLSKFKEPFATP